MMFVWQVYFGAVLFIMLNLYCQCICYLFVFHVSVSVSLQSKQQDQMIWHDMSVYGSWMEINEVFESCISFSIS